MNSSIHRISLDIHDTASQVSISAKRGDTARGLHIMLQENSKPYHIAEGCSAVFTGEKPDGNYLFNDCTIKDNVIIYDFTDQTVPVIGIVKCEIVLYDANNERITSPRFDIVIEGTVYNDEEIVSSDEANALISATAEAKSVTAEVKQKLANGDFIGEKGDKGDPGTDAVTDPKYDPSSANAQSGVALAPVFAEKQPLFADFKQSGPDEYTLDLSAIVGVNKFKIKYGPNEYLLFSQGELEIAGERINFFSAASEYSFGHSRLKAVATPEEDTDAANKEYVDSKATWETVLDVTLTAEQGGVSELMLALGDGATIATARRIRVALSFPVAEEKAANAFWTTVGMADKNKAAYNYCLVSGYNVKGSANATYFTTAAIDIFNFRKNASFTRGYQSVGILANPHYSVNANSNSNAKVIAGQCYPGAIKDHPPYIYATLNSGVTFKEGTHVFVEVQQ